MAQIHVILKPVRRKKLEQSYKSKIRLSLFPGSRAFTWTSNGVSSVHQSLDVLKPDLLLLGVGSGRQLHQNHRVLQLPHVAGSKPLSDIEIFLL